MLVDKITKIGLTAKIVVLLSTVMMALAYFLAYTATGLTWMLNSNMDDPAASISISSVSSKIGGSTTLRNLHYKSDFADIQFDHVTIHWNPLSIFANQLLIENLSGEGLSVDFKTQEIDSNLSTTLSFPKSTNVVAATIKGLEIKSNGKIIYTVANTTIDNIYLDESYFAENIVFNSIDGQRVKLSGQFGFSTNSVINLTTETLFSSQANNTSIRAKGTMVGNIAQLRFLQHVSAPFTADINGRIQHLFTSPSWVIDTKLNAIDLSVFADGKFFKNMSGNVAINGHSNKLEVNSNLIVKDFADKSWVASIAGHSNANMLEFKLGIKSDGRKGAVQAAHGNFTGSYDLASLITTTQKIAEGLNVKGQWAGMALPLNRANTIFAKSGNIEFEGSTYRAKINAEGIHLNALGPTVTRLALNTKKDSKGELIFNGLATSPNGKLHLSGSMVNRNNSFELDNLFLSGKNFTLVRNPQAHIIVSPNLSFVRNGKIMTSTGTINIPTANIQLQEFKNTIAALSSVIDSRKTSFGSTGYVDVKFGKSVWLHGYGLNAHVTGDVALLDMSNRQLVANGELNVLRGNYRTLNKEHALSGGHLRFNNHDLDNPQLDLNLKRAATSNSNKIIGRLQKLFKESSNEAKAKTSVDTSSKSTPVKKVAFLTYH